MGRNTPNRTRWWHWATPWHWGYMKPWEFAVLVFTIYGLPPILAFTLIAMLTGVRP